MNIPIESINEIVRFESIENLLLIAVLGKGDIRESARKELERRRIVEPQNMFEDSYMTNLSIVC